MKKIALCLRDVRVSKPEQTVNCIDQLLDGYSMPLTVHLVMDAPLDLNSGFKSYLRDRVNRKKIRIVFHGTTHRCANPGLAARASEFYHKCEAEYLDDSDRVRETSSAAYAELSAFLGYSPAICPPCWLATKKNSDFLQSLKPPMVEYMLRLHTVAKKLFSPVVSLGSSKKTELIFLRLLARLMCRISFMQSGSAVRFVVHVEDFKCPGSLVFFSSAMEKFRAGNYEPVFMEQLAD